MDYFQQIAQKFPQLLEADEQEQLLKDYYCNKNSDIHEKLLEHNLLLCLKAAREICAKYDYKVDVDEMFSICYEELSNSLEKYNPYHKSQAKFSTYALTNMRLHCTLKITEQYRQQSYLVDTVFMNDEEEHSFFEFFSDFNESHIAQDVGYKMLVDDIIKFIDTLNNGEILKMQLGIGYPKKYTQPEIAKVFGVSKQNISQKISGALNQLKIYISQNYSFSMPDYSRSNVIQFKSKDDRNQYIFETYYGLNGKTQKSLSQITEEVNLTTTSLKKIIGDYKATLPKEDSVALKNIFIPKNENNERYEDIFNSYYGLNGFKIYNLSQLQQKYGIHTSTLHSIEQKLIKQGKYTPEEIRQLKKTRNECLDNNIQYNHAYLYFSYYGTNGHTKKSVIELSHELNLAPNSIYTYVQNYKKYFSLLLSAERESEIAKYTKQPENQPE